MLAGIVGEPGHCDTMRETANMQERWVSRTRLARAAMCKEKSKLGPPDGDGRRKRRDAS